MATSAPAADDAKDQGSPDTRLVGTWKMVSAKFGGRENDLPKTMPTFKHITPGHFVWISYDPDTKEIKRAAGGTYCLKDDDYVETPTYGLSPDFQVVRDKAQKFKCKIEGKTWYHTGELSNGLTIEEVWERQDPK